MSQPTFPGGIDLLPGPQGPPIPANALRIVTIGGAPFSTTDGITFTALGGGSGTIHVGSGLQGDGSIGTPADLSATNKAILASVDSSWAQQEAIAIAAAIPAITQFKPLHVGLVVPVTTAPSATDPAVEGGGIFANSAAANTFFGQSVFQAPHTGKWSISFLCKLLGSGAAGHDNYVGVINAAGTHGYVWGWNHATSASKWTLQLYNTGSPTLVAGSLNGDSNIHVARIMFDGTTVSAAVDGTVVATTTTLTGLSDEPMYPVLYSATVKEVILVDCLVGFIPA